ncbi:mycothiol system anti-sigma-R factor [Rhabdothermincola salaria]|uniref:mycothiol system anti-sigma-R factor n=1 Tax=Rhabdothermincola salaria TaxID=2903142 RepID=UPI001E352CDC|nr:mycothiol system anti-sigma-R factor [Rhabdothermincola salaria]MCD9624649.1 mycothiol system anti-sigma-R factor [Rhabdothermincola salaria]
MTDMADHHHHDDRPTDCEEALAEIYTFLDGELTEAKRTAIASHLEGCNPCVEVFDFEAELRMVISTKATEPVPESLRLRISKTLLSFGGDEATDDDDDRAAF